MGAASCGAACAGVTSCGSACVGVAHIASGSADDIIMIACAGFTMHCTCLYEKFLSALSFVNLNFVQLLPVKCVRPSTDFFDRLV